jgi:hypothetical protein
MSTNLDKALSVPWSSSTASIISLGTDAEDPNQFSSLFDLVNGLYLIDSRFMEVKIEIVSKLLSVVFN